MHVFDIFFFLSFLHLYGKCGSLINIVNAVSKERTRLKQRCVSVKHQLIGIRVVKENMH